MCGENVNRPGGVCLSFQGTSTLETLLVCGLAATLISWTLPIIEGSRDALQARAATAYLAGRLHVARLEAQRQARYVALGFDTDPLGPSYALYADGDGDGVRSADIADGTDSKLGTPERLSDRFPGVRFGVVSGVPAVDPGESLDDQDPIRVGRARLISFSPLGSVTPGTLYLVSRGGRQYAIRLTGVTGRVRVLVFDSVMRVWRSR